MIGLGPSGNPGSSPHLKALNFKHTSGRLFSLVTYSEVQHVDILGSQSSADHSSHHRQTKARVIPLTDKALRGGPPLV